MMPARVLALGEMIRAAVGDTPDAFDGETHRAQIEIEGLEGLLHARRVIAAPRSAAVAAWQQAHRAVAATNLTRMSELTAVLSALRDARVEPLVLPGASLLRHYPDAGCRPMDDVDLLAPPGRREDVRHQLRQQGLCSAERHPDLMHRGCLHVDVHADLTNADRIRARRHAGWLHPDEVWARRRRVEVEGHRVWVLASEDEVLYTAAHALRHSYRRLTWFVDLALQLRQETLDWEHLRRLGTSSGLGRPLACALSLLDGWHVRLPDPAREWLASQRPPPVTRWLLERIVGGRATTCAGEVLWCLGTPGLIDRARLLAEFVFPRPDVMLQVFPRLPRRLAPLGYALRCGQLVGRGVAELTTVITRSASWRA